MADDPRLLPRAEAARGWWGGEASGQTMDWTYVLDDDVCQIVFGIPIGGGYTNSGGTFDVYERDIVWRVISGVLVAANPATGEVHRVEAGEALVCRGDTWHDGHNWGDELVTVVEFTAPAKTRARDVRPRSLPATLPSRDDAAAPSAHVQRRADIAWRLEGSCRRILVGHVLSTPSLTVGEVLLRPGQQTGTLIDPGVKTLLVVDGHVAVQWAEAGSWIEARAMDGAYLPPDTPHRLVNLGSGPATILFQSVPAAAGE